MKAICRMLQVLPKVLLPLTLALCGACSALYPQGSNWKPIIPSRQSPLMPLWRRSKIYIKAADETLLTVTKMHVVFVGSDDPGNQPFHAYALDRARGNTVWQYGDGRETRVLSDGSTVFIGSIGKVAALDDETGAVKWNRAMPLAGSVTKLLLMEDQLYVDTVSANLFVLDARTGDIIRTLKYMDDADIPVWSDNHKDLDLYGKIMYFERMPAPFKIITEIVALDASGLKQIWSSQVRAVTRLAANEQAAYTLTEDGRLLKFNLADGATTELMKFVPAPITRHQLDSGGYVERGYHIATDSQNQLLFISFEDSAELLAYQLPLAP